MPYQLGPVIFGNAAGAWAFSALIPFIIIYLIRPKPTQMEIPSLMFMMVSSDAPRQQSFLKRFARDWLFFIQLLILLLLASQFMEPYTTYQHDVTSENTVIVIDGSASSQTREGSTTRFEKSKDLAKSALGAKNTIILARSTPKIVLQDALAQDASEALDLLQPVDTPSSIGESMLLASEVLGNKEGRVIVLSDFINTQGIEPLTAQVVLKSKNLQVSMIDVAGESKKRNLGLTAMDAADDVTTVFMHNFNEEPIAAQLKVGDLAKAIQLSAGSTESFSFKTPEKITKIELSGNDDLKVDDVAWLSAPESKQIKVLLYTNNASVFLRNALTSTPTVDLTVIEPPLPPSGDFDVYVIADVHPDKVLPGTFESIAENVKKGKAAVICGQENMERVDYNQLSPVKVISKGQGGKIFVEQINKFTKNIDFGKANDLYVVDKASNAVSIASSLNTSVITYQSIGDGKTLYFGVLEKSSDFKLSPDYPVFWVRLLQFMTDVESIKNLNMKTGETLVLDSPQKITGPSGTITTNTIFLDRAGVYKLEDRQIAVNLFNEAESSINPKKILGEKSGDEIVLKPVKEDRKFNLEITVLAAALGLMMLELLYIKFRGDV
ncbi:MAG: BatA and WFA domain-containing protein [Nanoarchaeota archaeon]